MVMGPFTSLVQNVIYHCFFLLSICYLVTDGFNKNCIQLIEHGHLRSLFTLKLFI